MMTAYVTPYILLIYPNSKKFPTFAIVQALLRYGRKLTWPRRLVLNTIRITVNMSSSFSLYTFGGFRQFYKPGLTLPKVAMSTLTELNSEVSKILTAKNGTDFKST